MFTNVKVKTRDVMAASERGKANRSMCTTSESSVDSVVHLYTNTCIRGKKKQYELESLLLSQRQDIIGISETW